jgi:hypothetical protein
MSAAQRQTALLAWLRKHDTQYGRTVGDIFHGMLFEDPRVYDNGMGPHLERDLRKLERNGKVTRFDKRPFLWRADA